MNLEHGPVFERELDGAVLTYEALNRRPAHILVERRTVGRARACFAQRSEQ